MDPGSPALQAGSLPAELSGKRNLEINSKALLLIYFNLPVMQETPFPLLGWEDPLEKE